MGLKASSEELDKLKNLFISLDTSKDGTLSIEELRDGMDKMTGQLGGSDNVMEY